MTTRREWSGATEADPEVSPEASGVHTELGGVLYLVNLLARFDVHDFGLGDASAWDVVDGLARAALPHSEPSSPRLTDQAGSSVRDEFIAADPIWDVLASLAGRPAEAVDPEVVRRCVVVLRALEPALAFTDDETTWGSLLGVSGRVVADATHVELFTSAEQVHLAVRRRALDSDPGWVPALGRVVLFHFVGDQP